MSLTKRSTLILLLSLPVSCFAMPSATCSGNETIALVRSIVLDSIKEGLKSTNPEKPFLSPKIDITTILTVKRDETVGRVSCKAQLKVLMPGFGKRRLDELLIFSALSFGRQRANGFYPESTEGMLVAGIEYASQYTDDGKEQTVELSKPEILIGAVAKGLVEGPKPSGVFGMGPGRIVNDCSTVAAPQAPLVVDRPTKEQLLIREAFAQGHPEDELRIAKEWNAKDSSEWQSRLAVAGATLDLGKIEEAKEIYSSILKTAPNTIGALVGYGYALGKSNKNAAEEHMCKAIGITPYNLQDRRYQAMALIWLNKSRKAEQLIAEILKIDFTYELAWALRCNHGLSLMKRQGGLEDSGMEKEDVKQACTEYFAIRKHTKLIETYRASGLDSYESPQEKRDRDAKAAFDALRDGARK